MLIIVIFTLYIFPLGFKPILIKLTFVFFLIQQMEYIVNFYCNTDKIIH